MTRYAARWGAPVAVSTMATLMFAAIGIQPVVPVLKVGQYAAQRKKPFVVMLAMDVGVVVQQHQRAVAALKLVSGAAQMVQFVLRSGRIIVKSLLNPSATSSVIAVTN